MLGFRGGWRALEHRQHAFRNQEPPDDTLDTALIMAADTISGYIQGLLDGIEFKQTAYALDRGSRKAALARFLKRASTGGPEEEEHRLAA